MHDTLYILNSISDTLCILEYPVEDQLTAYVCIYFWALCYSMLLVLL